MFALVLVALWVPITSHCYLEQAGLVPFDDCCSSESGAASSSSDPCDAGCKMVEQSAICKTQNKQEFSAPAFVASYVLCTLFPPTIHVPPPAAFVAWPPDTLKLPQFVARTALPVRAPAFAS